MAAELAKNGTVASIRAGHKAIIAALASDGTPLAVGPYHPANGATEFGGIGSVRPRRSKRWATSAPSTHSDQKEQTPSPDGARTASTSVARQARIPAFSQESLLTIKRNLQHGVVSTSVTSGSAASPGAVRPGPRSAT